MTETLLNKNVTNSINQNDGSSEINQEGSSSLDFDIKLDPLGLGLSLQNRKELS